MLLHANPTDGAYAEGVHIHIPLSSPTNKAELLMKVTQILCDVGQITRPSSIPVLSFSKGPLHSKM